MDQTLETPVGLAAAWQIVATDPTTRLPIAGFLGTDALAATLWAGDDQAALASPACTWIDAPTARLKLALAAGDTASLALGTYRLRVVAAGATLVFDGGLRLTASPGAAVALSVYGPLADMQVYAPWIERIMDLDTTQSGFAEARHRARTWLEEVIQARYRGGNWGLGIGSGTYGFGGWATPVGPSKWLQDQLDAGKLLVTDRTREIVARHAIALVCEAQLGPSKAENPYADLAKRFAWQAEQLLAGYVAQIDTNADGIGDISINCGVMSLR